MSTKKTLKQLMTNATDEQKKFIREATKAQREAVRNQQIEIAKKLGLTAAAPAAPVTQTPAVEKPAAPVTKKQQWMQLRTPRDGETAAERIARDRMAAQFYSANARSIDREDFGD